MRSKENMFRRAAKDDLHPTPEVGTGIQIAEIPDPKNKAAIRRKILGTRETTVQSAKNPINDNKEFFSSRKSFGAGADSMAGDKKPGQAKKFQTDSSVA